MKKYLLIISIFFQKSHCQDTIRTNPIIFAEMVLGGAGSFGEYGGFLYGGSGNFQFKKNLFTVRYNQNPEFKFKSAVIPTVGFPYVESKFKNTEIAIMYGKRYVKNSVSYSFSGGLSSNDFETKYKDQNEVYKVSSCNYGFAYEFNVKWFNSKKKRYRIYMIAPIGKPTSFGRSFGFKLLGNVSEHSYLGIAMSYGFGWHKNY